jgi:hypothetical protein
MPLNRRLDSQAIHPKKGEVCRGHFFFNANFSQNTPNCTKGLRFVGGSRRQQTSKAPPQLVSQEKQLNLDSRFPFLVYSSDFLLGLVVTT